MIAFGSALILLTAGGVLYMVWRENLVRAPRAARRYDRARPLALTVGFVICGGVALAWIGEQLSAPPLVGHSAPDPRGDPGGHARAQRAVEIDRRFQQGVMMLHAKEYEHAVTAFHRVLELAPEMPEAHVNMGFALVGMGRHAAGRDFFNSAIELRPRQLNAYYGLAVALESLGDRAGAMGAMRTYVHLSRPEDPHLRKAQSALWEWESALAAERRAGGKNAVPVPAQSK